MKQLTPLLLVLVALLCFCVAPATAQAHTTINPMQRYTPMQRYVPAREPNSTITSFRGRVYFTLSFVLCRVQTYCLSITNRLNQYVYLYLNGRYYDPLWPGETISPTLRYGRNVFTVPGLNRYVVLVVTVQPPVRYGWWWY